MKGYKTLAVNVGIAILGVATAFDWSTVTQDPKLLGWILTGSGVVNMILRSVTNTPVASKE